MENRKLIREIQALVSIAAKMIRSSLDERLAIQYSGITALQFGILQIIQRGPQTITEISRVQMLDPSTLVPAVDALERRGLAQRTKDPKDRRRTPLAITMEGRALLTQVPMLDEDDVLVKGLTQMSQDRQEQLLDLMRELVRDMKGDGSVEALTAAIDSETPEA